MAWIKRPIQRHYSQQSLSNHLSTVAVIIESSSVPKLTVWLPWCDANYSKQDAADWLHHCQRAWEGSIEYPMGVFDTATNSPVGGVGINKIDPTTRSANLGYWTGTPWVNRGVAKYAAREAIDISWRPCRGSRLPTSSNHLAFFGRTGASLRARLKVR